MTHRQSELVFFMQTCLVDMFTDVNFSCVNSNDRNLDKLKNKN